jgi:hypothetical protein
MKKMDFGQTITVLANLAVLAGIAFLAYEMRQNTQVARQEAYYAFTQTMNENAYSLANDAELAEMIGRAMDGEPRSSFTNAERLRIDVHWISLLRVWEALYRSRQEGIADDSYFGGLALGMGPYENDYFREWWPTARATLSEDFAEFFETQVLQ